MGNYSDTRSDVKNDLEEIGKARKEVDVRLMLMEIIMFVVSAICGLLIFIYSQNMGNKACQYLEKTFKSIAVEMKIHKSDKIDILKQEIESMAVELKINDKAPGFGLVDQGGEKANLSDFAGKKVLVYFYPKADTPGCTTQACSVRDSTEELKKLGVIPLGISPDEPNKQQKFDEKYSLGFRLLSDADHKAAKAYGVWGEKSMYGKKYMGIIRSSFLIDEDGKLIGVWYKVKPEDTISKALETLNK